MFTQHANPREESSFEHAFSSPTAAHKPSSLRPVLPCPFIFLPIDMYTYPLNRGSPILLPPIFCSATLRKELVLLKPRSPALPGYGAGRFFLTGVRAPLE